MRFAVFPPEFPPGSESIPPREEQEKTPGQESREEYGNVVQRPAGAMGLACGKPEEALLPKGVLRKVGIADGNGDKPWQCRRQEDRHPEPPMQPSHVSQPSAQSQV